MTEKETGRIEPAVALELVELVQYAEGAVVSRTIVDRQQGTLTLFAFDEEQGLSEHSTPFAAYVIMLDGEADIIIGGEPIPARAGQIVLMPAGVPHSVRANGRFKMLLAMIRA